MEGYDDALDLFSTGPSEIGIQQREWVEVAPIATIMEDSPIEFNLQGNPLRYIDLCQTFLNVKIQVLKSDGTHIPKDASVAPINLTLQSIWRQVDLKLGQVPIPGVGTNYPYKAYIDTLLLKNANAKKTQLQGQLYNKDKAGFMDDTSFGGNLGFNWRQDKVANSVVCEMEGPLFLDLAQQDKFLLNNVSCNVKLWPQNIKFKLMTDTSPPDYKMIIKDATLRVCQVTVNPKIILGHDAALNHGMALYPYIRSDIKTYSIAEGTFNVRIDNLFNGEIPMNVVVGIVTGEAYNGSFDKNPFNFQNFDLDLACFYVNNNPTPQKGFTPLYLGNFAGSYTCPYMAIFGEEREQDFGNDIELNDYPRGYALYKFNISSQDQIQKQGSTRLELSFKQALPTVATVIVYAKFPSLMRIDKSRKVIL